MTHPPVLVGLETSGPLGSVAVAADGMVLARAFLGDRGGHAPGLIPALEQVLTQAGVARTGIGGVVVGAGPGSFTGVRVAAAAGKGLAHALGVPLWAVSSFLAAALTEVSLPHDAGPWRSDPTHAGLHRQTRYILFDARGDRVFAAAYRLTDGLPLEVRAPRFAHLPEILADEELAGAAFCGDGAARHGQRLRAAGRLVLPPPLGFPSADGLLTALAVAPATPPLADPFGWEPDYLRASNAERGRGQ